MTTDDALSFLDGQGHRVAGLLSLPARDTDRIVILCHGFLSNKNSTTNRTLTRLLSEAGIGTFRFDFFGQGESEGALEDVTVSLAVGQASAAVDVVLSRGYKRIGLAGSSFGGLVGILTTARRPEIACLALKCPVVDFAEELRLEFGADELARWQATDTIPNIMGGPERVRLKYGLYQDSLANVAYVPARAITAATLIVQGERDELIPLHQSRQLLDALAGEKRLDLLPDADHQFTRADDFHVMTRAITDWFRRHLRSSNEAETGR